MTTNRNEKKGASKENKEKDGRGGACPTNEKIIPAILIVTVIT